MTTRDDSSQRPGSRSVDNDHWASWAIDGRNALPSGLGLEYMNVPSNELDQEGGPIYVVRVL